MGAGGVKNFSVGICDGAPSTARSSWSLSFLAPQSISRTYNIWIDQNFIHEFSDTLQLKIDLS